MIIGENNPDTVLQRLDNVDNGHRNGGNAESLYLFGNDSDDALRILNGSTLVLNGLNVYAMVDVDANGQTDGQQELLHLNSLFDATTENVIAFDGGFLMNDTPPTVINVLVNGTQ